MPWSCCAGHRENCGCCLNLVRLTQLFFIISNGMFLLIWRVAGNRYLFSEDFICHPASCDLHECVLKTCIWCTENTYLKKDICFIFSSDRSCCHKKNQPGSKCSVIQFALTGSGPCKALTGITRMLSCGNIANYKFSAIKQQWQVGPRWFREETPHKKIFGTNDPK